MATKQTYEQRMAAIPDLDTKLAAAATALAAARDAYAKAQEETTRTHKLWSELNEEHERRQLELLDNRTNWAYLLDAAVDSKARYNACQAHACRHGFYMSGVFQTTQQRSVKLKMTRVRSETNEKQAAELPNLLAAIKPQPPKDVYDRPNNVAGWKLVEISDHDLSSNGCAYFAGFNDIGDVCLITSRGYRVEQQLFPSVEELLDYIRLNHYYEIGD